MPGDRVDIFIHAFFRLMGGGFFCFCKHLQGGQ